LDRIAPEEQVFPRARRVTIIDLLSFLVVVLLVSGGVIPGLAQIARSGGARTQCASNLRQIGQALQIYAMANNGSLPRTIYDGTAGPTAFTAPDAPDPFAAGGPGPNDVTAAMFLLVRTTEIGLEAFVCPGARGTPWNLSGKARSAASNFPVHRHIGYSFGNPYPSEAAVAAGFKWDYTLTWEFALAADINPGAPTVVAVRPNSPRAEMKYANSPNHTGDGQNVLYADGHIEFQNTVFCGMLRTPAGPGIAKNAFRDNIYTFGAGFGGAAGVGVVGAPVDAVDSVLLPVAPAGHSLAPNRLTPIVVACVTTAVVLTVAFVLFLRRRRSASA
jgi:prepilin-type processing-associated H-X9-DG protein